VVVLISLATGTAAAGTSFRLEVGLPVAAGVGNKIKNAVLVVRPVVCADPASARITATAEGLVNGRRHSLPVKVLALPTPGVHAVERQWPDGHWVLHLRGTCPNPRAESSTIVGLTPTSFSRERTEVLVEPATPAQIESALAAVVRAAAGS
jgi:hypothetical protein